MSRASSLLDLPVPVQSGHFRYESGHHGSLWFDLELLCLNPATVRPHAKRLAALVARHDVEMICGPLNEGAFVALMVAEELALPFVYTTQMPAADPSGFFPVGYRIPDPLRIEVHGRRVAIVNDLINAGSAVLGSLQDLRKCGADVVAIGSLVVLGDAPATLASDNHASLECLNAIPHAIWTPETCPQCARGEPLVCGRY
jgi:orotate phosphoribosyltransferase